MKFISVCSGIEAASVAWEPLGWQAVAFSEIEKFPSAVLAHHWPDVPNLGDMTRWREWPEDILSAADILCGGTPCQAFSIAGLRQSLADERGNLTLTYVQILDKIDHLRARDGRPSAVCMWENVPGVLNTDDNAFGCFLAALAGEGRPLTPPGGRWTDAGYVRGPRRAIAWRSLDAQYFGLAQRRQRVFVVASARDDFRPEEVLFEFQGVRRDSPPSRKTGQGVTGTLSARTEGGGGLGTDFELGGGLIETLCMATGQAGAEIGIGIGTTLNCNHEAPIVTQEVAWPLTSGMAASAARMPHEQGALIPEITHALTGEGFDAGEDGTGRGTPIIPAMIADPISTRPYQDRGSDDNNLICVHGTQDPCTDEEIAFALGRNSGQENAIAFSCKDHGADAGLVSPTLRSMGHDGSHANGGGQVAVAFQPRIGRNGRGYEEEISPALTGADSGATSDSRTCVAFSGRIRGDDGRGYGREEQVFKDGITGPIDTVKPHCVAGPTMAVRRLLPVECARLMGFPDGHTDISPKGKPTADGPQYKAYGNSWAVPCAQWIGRRIAAFIGRGAA